MTTNVTVSSDLRSPSSEVPICDRHVVIRCQQHALPHRLSTTVVVFLVGMITVVGGGRAGHCCGSSPIMHNVATTPRTGVD
eukprot:scaffold128518_cov37-Cyclotella_meneghiniana.AAC.3